MRLPERRGHKGWKQLTLAMSADLPPSTFPHFPRNDERQALEPTDIGAAHAHDVSSTRGHEELAKLARN